MSKMSTKSNTAVKRKRESSNVTSANAHITTTMNNVAITITKISNGEVLVTKTAGKVGFKGSRRGTPHAGQVTAEAAANEAKQHGIRTLACVYISGVGSQMPTALKKLGEEFDVLSLVDETPFPHNGCRPPKRRRV